jgi:hypothetical protein
MGSEARAQARTDGRYETSKISWFLFRATCPNIRGKLKLPAKLGGMWRWKVVWNFVFVWTPETCFWRKEVNLNRSHSKFLSNGVQVQIPIFGCNVDVVMVQLAYVLLCIYTLRPEWLQDLAFFDLCLSCLTPLPMFIFFYKILKTVLQQLFT